MAAAWRRGECGAAAPRAPAPAGRRTRGAAAGCCCLAAARVCAAPLHSPPCSPVLIVQPFPRRCRARRPDTGRDLLLVGGTEVGQEERYGYIARIHFLLDGRLGLLGGCGGTLIARRVVLTAAQ